MGSREAHHLDPHHQRPFRGGFRARRQGRCRAGTGLNDLNYNHLRYFWTVAREGSISRAAKTLGLTQPAVSARIRALERSLGDRLFRRKGRGIALTEFGQMVQGYAEQMFAVAGELSTVVRDRPSALPHRLIVGVTHGMPKLAVHHLLEPALRLPDPVRLQVRDDRPQKLIADLVIEELDLVLVDVPPPATSRARVFSHALGESEVMIFGAPSLVSRHHSRFPRSLDGAPFILPIEGTTLRRSLEEWFVRNEIKPVIVAEVADSMVMREFGRSGLGFFASLTAMSVEIIQIHGVRAVGTAEGIRERFYALSLERRLRDPAVVAIITNARKNLFA